MWVVAAVSLVLTFAQSPGQISPDTKLDLTANPLRFLTRMHAQCELHAWVAGEDRRWLADLVEDGFRDGVMRAEFRRRPTDAPYLTGWRALVDALRRTAAHPVVMSYSVCEQFPRRDLADFAPEYDSNATWDDADDEYRWAACMPAIAHLQLTPVNLREQGFGDGLSALDFGDAVHAAREVTR